MPRSMTSDEQKTFERLSNELGSHQQRFDIADAYYDGAQRLELLGLAIPPELERFTVIVAWPGMVADAVVDRLEVKGFRLPGQDGGDADLWRIWQANHMDEQDQLAALDFQIYGRTYRCVGANEGDERTPLITVESPRNIITDRDPRTGQIRAALRLYDKDDNTEEARAATLYFPDETLWLERRDGTGAFEVTDRDDHGMGVVPVVPSFRRRRTSIPSHRTMQGSSVMERIIPVTDAAARNLTNAQVAQEVLAVPQRGVLGASKGDFVDASGKPLTTWEAYFGAVWAISNGDAKTFQFDSADMRNFELMSEHYARLASGLSGLPPNYFGLAADDAASADAIRSREARLVRAVERDQVTLGNGDEDVLRLVYRIRDGVWSDDLVGMETLWHDAGTPTYASRVDAVVKMYAATDEAGRSLLPAEMAMEELGWSPAKVARAMQLRRDEQRDPYLEVMKGAGADAAGADASALG